MSFEAFFVVNLVFWEKLSTLLEKLLSEMRSGFLIFAPRK